MFVTWLVVTVVLSLAACGPMKQINTEHIQPKYHTMTLPTLGGADVLSQTEKKTPTEKRSGDGGPRYTPL